MGLMDEIKSDERAASPRTKRQELKDKLSPEDYDDFVKALNDPNISQAAIRRALAARGIHVASGTLSQMRSGVV